MFEYGQGCLSATDPCQHHAVGSECDCSGSSPQDDRQGFLGLLLCSCKSGRESSDRCVCIYPVFPVSLVERHAAYSSPRMKSRMVVLTPRQGFCCVPRGMRSYNSDYEMAPSPIPLDHPVWSILSHTEFEVTVIYFGLHQAYVEYPSQLYIGSSRFFA